jgi:hypothetical protein
MALALAQSFDEVSLLPESKGRVRFLSEDERTRLLAEAAKDPQLHTFTVIALSTASRAGELWNLTWSDTAIAHESCAIRQKRCDRIITTLKSNNCEPFLDRWQAACTSSRIVVTVTQMSIRQRISHAMPGIQR